MARKRAAQTSYPAFKANLRRAMEDAGVSCKELQDALCVERSSAYNWTSGGRLPRTLTLRDMARMLGTTMEALLEGVD